MITSIPNCINRHAGVSDSIVNIAGCHGPGTHGLTLLFDDRSLVQSFPDTDKSFRSYQALRDSVLQEPLVR